MLNELQIRRAVLDDAAAIAEIYNQSVLHSTATFDTEPKSVDERRQWIDAHGDRFPVFVAEVDGQVAGWAALTQWSDRKAYDRTAETSFYVSADFRGRGLGRGLMRHLLDVGRDLEFHVLLALIVSENPASLHVCKSLGFEHCGTMKEVGFKFGRPLDVLILQQIVAK
ncbi:GNAT family N-acetyltransferase [Roseiconus lacunae]|uniref:N-acetyltransferase family protein n=1 Tax=Roseiconus lacunae TaxID=2605694 RepID=A0ABT7PDB6_9BACT|nr:GNAT family N-acetyltransferase [Roseiconus lacunae]MCD0459790.1 N-acetyltransferase family protein [Roseiconus lacunae]MDM4014487.1 N-acetyltransferase family protein [Roseiconus lacunae]WRQ49803.1 GNAT family N-acetyltransferase [Stieleria sp. HD01]